MAINAGRYGKKIVLDEEITKGVTKIVDYVRMDENELALRNSIVEKYILKKNASIISEYIVDIILLASGFILRVYYGASIINVEVSDWLFLTILSGSLFLGLGKRKKELITSEKSRKVLQEYNEAFLDKFQYVTLGLMLVFYSLWVIEQDIKYLSFTIPLIIIIFMRYCLIIEKSDEGDPTTILYQDKFLMVLSLIFGISMIFFLVIL